MDEVNESMIQAGLAFIYHNRDMKEVHQFWNFPIHWRRRFVEELYKAMNNAKNA